MNKILIAAITVLLMLMFDSAVCYWAYKIAFGEPLPYASVFAIMIGVRTLIGARK